MKTPPNYFILIFLSILPLESYAFPEIPFCPAGGPPGWLNHFNHKRDQNIWRLQHRRYQYTPIQPNANYYYTPSYRPGLRPDLKTLNAPDYTMQPGIPYRHYR